MLLAENVGCDTVEKSDPMGKICLSGTLKQA